MSEQKELGKFELVPTVDQLMAVVEYFEKNVTDSGRVHFTQSKMIESPIINAHIKSASYVSGVTTYLANEGFIKKVEIGSRHMQSVWDVSKLLNEWDKVRTRDVTGTAHIVRDNVEVEVVRKKEETPVAKGVSPNNQVVLEQLKHAMDDMMGYLQSLPTEMSTHLRSISDQLELTDKDALDNLKEKYEKLEKDYEGLKGHYEPQITDLQAQKKDLESEVRSLKTELEEVSSKVNYNTTSIYRQRNSIMDEVDRMITGPSWTIRQNGVNIRNSIEQKLDAIMKEIGVEKE